MNDIYYWNAVELVQAIKRRTLSVREVMQAHADRIEQVNGKINALVSLDLDRALEAANAADIRLARGEQPGPLFGLPVAHKDSYLTKGLRTTFGSRLHKDFIPAEDSAVVARQRAAGAIMVGKSNMPEFGAGSHTFNDVFGITRNPYRLDVSAGGSSGGAAAALASGMVALADGSDMGGSLRNPASFCNVVGLRPSIGRVPMAPGNHPFNVLTTGGPMGRCVADVALLLDVISGSCPQDPLALDSQPGTFFPLAHDYPRGRRIALSPTLGDLPFAPEVRAALQEGVAALQAMGCVVDEKEPDFEGADLAFETFRALAFAANYGQLNAQQLESVKETIRWNIDQGLSLTGAQVADASRAHGRMFTRMQALLQDYDFLIAPVSQVAPFPVDQEYPREIAGVTMPDYICWMRSCSRISVTGHPALSMPCSLTADGRPIGIQIVGRYRQERTLLAFAHAVEQALPIGRWHPTFMPSAP